MNAGEGTPSPYDDLRFILQVFEDSRRTIVCSPDLESRLKTQIEARGLAGLLTVKVSPILDDDNLNLLLIDEGAIKASANQALTRRAPMSSECREVAEITAAYAWTSFRSGSPFNVARISSC